MSNYDTLLTTAGLIYLSILSLRILNFLYIHLRPSSLHLYHTPGAWALVTGASDGIGRAFARNLSAKGFNVILHGRNQTKLEGVMADLKKVYPKTQYRIVTADASNSHGMKQAIEDIANSLHDLPGPLTILINNVGGTSNLPRTFLALRSYTSADVDGVINLNARFTTQLTRALLPMLSANGQKGLVMNLSSLAGVIGTPYTSVYSGTKAYLSAWSTSLSRELALDGIPVEVLSLVVGRVTDTVFFKEQASLFTPGSNTLAKAALGKVGCGQVVVEPYWGHGLQMGLVTSLPVWMQSAFTNKAVVGEKEAEDKRM